MLRKSFPVLAGFLILWCGSGSLRAEAASKTQGSARLDFNRDILPILSDNCFACHGPDDKERKGKLRLDIESEAVKAAKSGDFAIVPGHPEKSQVIDRVKTTNEDDIMPPVKTGKKLTSQQIEKLTQWIAEGAKYKGHWAFSKPERPAVPAIKNPSWAKNEIDRFIGARLDSEKLAPLPEADKPTLIRRATQDLTGLPPSPQEIDAFLADESPKAYEKVVDRLLQSPAYGEHMARYWLDAARYADSHGYHIDSERSLWKWRDWVVGAFNKNMPFDQFTVEQLAGDLLPEASTEQKIASGYIRSNMSTGEGGAIEEEYQAKYTFDRLETTSTIWLGLTMTCARCHTHKYDPITHQEYYQLYAFFNGIDESIMDGNRPNPDPFIKLPTAGQKERQEWLKDAISDGQKKLNAEMPELDAAQAVWEKRWRSQLDGQWKALSPEAALSTNGTHLRVLDDKSVLAEGEAPKKDTYDLRLPLSEGKLGALRLEAIPHESLPLQSAARSPSGRFSLTEIEASLSVPTGKEGESNKIEALKFNLALANASEGDQDGGKAVDKNNDTGWSAGTNALSSAHGLVLKLNEPVSIRSGTDLQIRLRFEKEKESLGRFRLSAAQDEDLIAAFNPPKPQPWKVIGPFKSEGLDAGFAKVYEPEHTLDFKKKYPGAREEISWRDRPEFEDGKRNQLVNELHGVHGAYYLHRIIQAPSARKMEVSVRADDLFKLWVNDELVLQRSKKEQPGEDPLAATINLKEGDNKFLLKIVNYVDQSNFTFKKDSDDDSKIPVNLAALFSTVGEARGNAAREARSLYRRNNSKDWKDLEEKVRKLRDENEALEREIPTTMVAKEMSKPRETFMLVRGEYDKKGDKVGMGVLSFLNAFPEGAPTNRLGLARWLLAPENPLTARVTVNRFWQQYFGTGLVKTTEDFGVQGEFPSHPELLDWLATEFIRTGWDVKQMQRLIVTSAAYRQTSKATSEMIARDPENRLIARGPRLRLDAEALRDTALAVSGLLVRDRGGPSARPYQPPGLWEAVSFNNSQKYVPDTGDGLHRRSLYTHWKRQSPPPSMLIFDAPTREYCVVKRPRTNTPLQALAFLNDPQIVEASRAFGERMMTEGGAGTDARASYGFRLATGRLPSKSELDVLRGIYEEQLADFEGNPDAVPKLLDVGEFKPNKELDAKELAAWSIVGSVILNLDETLTKN